jgi:hypothetical protein
MILGITAKNTRPASAGGPGEPFYNLVRSLQHFNGADGSTTFTDQKGISWVSTGDPELDTAQSVFGGAALHLDGNDYITSTDASLAWGTGDFTIECWVRFSALSGNNFVFTWGAGWGLYTRSGGWSVFDGVGSEVIVVVGTVVINTWYHVAISRRGSTLRFFVNGVQLGGNVTNSTNHSSAVLRLGAQPGGIGLMTGWIDEARATAAARYVSNFTTPAAEFLNAKGDPNFANVVSLIHWNGANGSTTYTDQIVARTWTNGTQGGALTTADFRFSTASLKFSLGGANQVDSDAGADFTYGTGDWTIEWWFKTPSNAGTIMMWDQRGPNNAPCVFQQSGTLYYYPGFIAISGTSPMLSATWQHWAVSKIGNITRLFCDGTQIGSNYADTINYPNGRVRLGTNGDTSGGFGTNTGWYDDVRVTKGVGRYAANFNPLPDSFPDSL